MSQDLIAPPVTEQQIPWRGFKYVGVRGLIDRKVARFLRTQRKNMLRFFRERGMSDLAAQMETLRKNPRMNFMEKNTIFQRILNEHIARSVPQAQATEAAAAVEAAPVLGGGSLVLPGVPESVVAVHGDHGDGPDAGGGVQGVALGDVGEPVIEE